jgi:hypothetical protein
MTGSANRDIVSKGRRDSCGAKLMGVLDIRHSDLNSSVISVVLHCSPFTIHLLLSSSLFPMLYASFATDNGLLTTDAQLNDPNRLVPCALRLMPLTLCSMLHALCVIGTPVAYD